MEFTCFPLKNILAIRKKWYKIEISICSNQKPHESNILKDKKPLMEFLG